MNAEPFWLQILRSAAPFVIGGIIGYVLAKYLADRRLWRLWEKAATQPDGLYFHSSTEERAKAVEYTTKISMDILGRRNG